MSFPYWRINPNYWAAVISAQSPSLNELFIPWGVHEATMGMSDFHKSPKLRLEKLFQIYQQQQKKIQLIVGFPYQEPLGLPEWLPTKTTSLVPEIFVHSVDSLNLLTLPSLFCAKLTERWLHFLEQVFALVELYLYPDGPIEKISFDFGFYSQDLNLMASPIFLEVLQSRYPDLKTFNFTYQTNFSSWDSLSQENAWKSLLHKSSWQACFDYSSAKELLLNSWFENLREKFPSLKLLTRENLSNDRWIDHDPIWLQSDGENYFPASPFGITNPSSLGIWSSMKVIEEVFENPLLQDKKIFLSGPKTTQATLKRLKEVLEKGQNLVCPLGIPKLDENNQVFWRDLKSEAQRGSWRQYSCSGGKIFSPIKDVKSSSEVPRLMASFGMEDEI